jgi:hypothetical protein
VAGEVVPRLSHAIIAWSVYSVNIYIWRYCSAIFALAENGNVPLSPVPFVPSEGSELLVERQIGALRIGQPAEAKAHERA